MKTTLTPADGEQMEARGHATIQVEHEGGRQAWGTRFVLPDTHAHLDALEFVEDCYAVIDRAVAAGVSPVLAVGSDLATSMRAVELATHFPTVYAAVGIHPHHADRFEREGAAVRELLAADNVVALGEIGLDYYRDGVDRGTQFRAFAEQLKWAADAGLPVSVHNRNADDAVLAAIEDRGVTTILHCFSGTELVARRALDAGCFISFAGNVTFPRATALREVAAFIPDHRLLLESDAPVLAPQPWRGRRNEPAYVLASAQVVADARDSTLHQVAASVTANARTVFGWRTA